MEGRESSGHVSIHPIGCRCRLDAWVHALPSLTRSHSPGQFDVLALATAAEEDAEET